VRWEKDASERVASAVDSPSGLQPRVISETIARTVLATTLTRSMSKGDRSAGQRTMTLTLTLSKEAGEWQLVQLAEQQGS
jgi:hypothetical protein